MSDLTGTEQSDHLLLTVLGTNPSPARYTLGGREVQAHLAPVALLDLLPEADRPYRVLALCTPEAKQNLCPQLVEALSGRCKVECVEVPSGNEQDHVIEFLGAVTGAIPENAYLTVDVTHGFRHFSFLMYTAVLYLAALRGVRVRGAYYGLLNQRPDGTSPFLDLKSLIELPRWVHAIETLSETGSALPMAKLLGTNDRGGSVSNIARSLRRLSEAYLSGLPLEIGAQAQEILRQHRRPLKKLLRNEHKLPLADELAARFYDVLRPQSLEASLKASGQGWKRRIELSKDELDRQASIIDNLLEHGHIATALGLMDEWTVSWVVWRQRGESWLEYHTTRKSAASLLGAIREVGNDSELRGMLDDDQRELGKFWDRLFELRNGYAHHGMRRQPLVGDGKTEANLSRVRDYWQGTLKRLPEVSLYFGESSVGRVLVSPIGNRPGVLFSAVEACRENGDGEETTLCIVICSRESEKHIPESLAQAGYEGDVKKLRVEDPFGGGNEEIERLVREARPYLPNADEVLVNVTGGTTLMGIIAEKVASEARCFARPVRRFGLVDRRPPTLQDADPYQAGEAFWLDGERESDGH